MSSVSASPSKISMRLLNNPVPPQLPTGSQRPSFVPPIRKLVPGEDGSPRQLSLVTADTTVVSQ